MYEDPLLVLLFEKGEPKVGPRRRHNGRGLLTGPGHADGAGGPRMNLFSKPSHASAQTAPSQTGRAASGSAARFLAGGVKRKQAPTSLSSRTGWFAAAVVHAPNLSLTALHRALCNLSLHKQANRGSVNLRDVSCPVATLPDWEGLPDPPNPVDRYLRYLINVGFRWKSYKQAVTEMDACQSPFPSCI